MGGKNMIQDHTQRQKLGAQYYKDISTRKTVRGRINMMNKYYQLGVPKSVIKQGVPYTKKWFEEHQNDLLFS